jgi:hypothetical protein
VPALALVYKANAGEPFEAVFGACLRDRFEWEIADLKSEFEITNFKFEISVLNLKRP